MIGRFLSISVLGLTLSIDGMIQGVTGVADSC